MDQGKVMRSLAVMFLMLVSTIALAQTATHPRVYVEAMHSHVYVNGVDHAVPRLEDAYGHNQTMELAKTFFQRCPEVTLTTREDKADFRVTLNWTPRTRFFDLGKVFHKPDQVLVVNGDGDILYSGVARSVGGNTNDVCKVIMTNHRAVVAAAKEPVVAQAEAQVGPDDMKYWKSAPPAGAPSGMAYQCSEFTVDRLGMKDCTKWMLK
jgi:hypothetical protein